MFSESSCVSLKLGIKQSKLVESSPRNGYGFFENCANLKQPYCFYQSSMEPKHFVKLKETQLLYSVNKSKTPFKGLYKMKS